MLTGPSIVNCVSNDDGFGQCLQGKLADAGLLPRPAAPPVVAEVEPAAETVSTAVVPAEPVEEIAEPALDVVPAAEPVDVPDNLIAATFGLLRAEPDGSVVIAGSGTPGSEIEVFANGSLLGRATVETSGDWVLVPDAPLPPGPLEITLGEKGKIGQAAQSFVVVIDEGKTAQPLVVASTPGQASDILQGLERPASGETTQVAVADPVAPPSEAAPATEPAATEPSVPAAPPAADVAAAPAETPTGSPEPAPAEPAAASPEPAPAEAVVASSEPAQAEPPAVSSEPPPAEPATAATASAPVADVPAVEGASEPVAETPAPAATAVAPPATAPAAPEAPVTAADPAPAEPAATTDEPDAAPATEAEPVVEPAPAEPDTQLAAVEDTPAPTPPPAPALADAPPTIDAIELEGDKTFFAGGGPEGGIVRLYVDDAYIADATVAAGRWLVEAGPVLDKPSQRIRVDLLQSGSSTVVARAEVDFVVDLPAIEPPVAIADAPLETPPAPVAPAVSPAETPPEPVADVPAPTEPVADTPAQPGTPQAPATPAPTGASPAPAPVAEPSVEAPAIAQAPAAPEAPPAPAAETATVSAPAPTPEPVVPATDPTPAVPTMVAVSVGGVDAQRFAAGKAIIRRGDNLWTIARRVYGTGVKFTTIYEANTGQIRDPDRIYPGQVFNLPTD